MVVPAEALHLQANSFEVNRLAKDSFLHAADVTADMEEVLFDRLKTEYLGVSTVNVPVGGMKKFRYGANFCEEAREGFKMAWQSKPGDAIDHRRLFQTTNPQEVLDALSQIQHQQERIIIGSEIPSFAAFAEIWAVLLVLHNSGVVTIRDLNPQMADEVGEVIANEGYIWPKVTPEFIWQMIGEL